MKEEKTKEEKKRRKRIVEEVCVNAFPTFLRTHVVFFGGGLVGIRMSPTVPRVNIVFLFLNNYSDKIIIIPGH